MKKLGFAVIGVTIFLAGEVGQAAEQAEESRYNIILLDICSARADHFSSYGYGRPTTPQLDQFAEEAAVFERAMAQASWCLPNYASLMTGQEADRHGLYVPDSAGLSPAQMTLAERLQAAGYATAAFSGGRYLTRRWGMDQGFDQYVNDFASEEWIKQNAGDAKHAPPVPFARTLPRMLSWLSQQGSRPFFLYVAIDDLHTPYHAEDSERYDAGYDGLVHEMPLISVAAYRIFNGQPKTVTNHEAVAGAWKAFRRDPRHLRHLIAHYDAALYSVDRQLGAFFAELRRRGLWDKTVIVVTADHGELLGEHDLLGHTESLYEPVLRVPLLVRHPGLAAIHGKRFPQLVMRIDLMPTVLDMAGASARDTAIQGRSLWPLLHGDTAEHRAWAFAGSRPHHHPSAARFGPGIQERVVTDGRYKLHFYVYKGRYELYDLLKDPGETRDLSTAQPGRVRALSFKLLEHLGELGVPGASLSLPPAILPQSAPLPPRPMTLNTLAEPPR